MAVNSVVNRDGNLSKNRTAKIPAPPQNISFGVKILIGALITSVIIAIAVITGFVVYASSNHCVICNTTLTTTPNMTNFPNFTIEHPRIPNFENENITEPPVIEIKMDAISYASTLKTAERETRTNLTDKETAPLQLTIEKDAQNNLDSSRENLHSSLSLLIDKVVLGISESKTDSSLVSSQQQQESINSNSKKLLRPFSCPICKRGFKRIERLQRHSRIHQS
uniref:C2H2-type domain-containing protein n=1 Tax=Daphnia galeata TaxID=27404 RepID=A0A8J2WJ19_9CRUS|nr:unnamed protein product [Daphnia galeata]